MILGLDSKKKISVITTYKLLEFLGDLGGFKQAVDLCLGAIGVYVSSRMFKADFISKLFQKEVVNDRKKSSVSFSLFHVLFEPIIAFFLKYCCSGNLKTL